ncbi:MAG: hypothetical protein GQ570_08385 [Helicobacteraceae bacterium]|nr:hypothetical protein [Helicobacteraceae bacterium]
MKRKTHEELIQQYEGKTFTNNLGLDFKILKFIGTREQNPIQFIKSKYTRTATTTDIRAGEVKDHYSPSIYKVGCYGIPNKKLTYWKRAKQLWNNILKRCYSEKDDKGYLGRVTVDSRWLVFEYFLEDISKLEGFKLWIDYNKMELDKDILGDSKLYSKHVCKFVTGTENRQEQGARKTRNKLLVNA